MNIYDVERFIRVRFAISVDGPHFEFLVNIVLDEINCTLHIYVVIVGGEKKYRDICMRIWYIG